MAQDNVETQMEDEQGESERLLPASSIIPHKDSVYSLMLFQPPLARKEYGHYLTGKVGFALALFIVNVALQVGLTWIAGSDIQSAALAFQTSLVNHNKATTAYMRILDETMSVTDRIVGRIIEAKTNSTSSCCDGAECALRGLRCCADRARPHSEMRQNDTRKHAKTPVKGNKSSFVALSNVKPAAKSKGKDGPSGSEENSIERPLCHWRSGDRAKLLCTPAIYNFVDAWDELDRDGDGNWTLEEARADDANLGCKFRIPVEEVFRRVCFGIMSNLATVPSSVFSFQAVPKSYFEWWTGLAVLCVVPDVGRCRELVANGIFDTAIGAGQKLDRTAKTAAVRNLDSALAHCVRLLRPGGVCESTMPGAYMIYRSRVVDKCGASNYLPGISYSNPLDENDAISTVRVQYAAVDEYKKASSTRFVFFQGLILFLWLLNLVGELHAVIEQADFIMCFPKDGTLPLLTPDMRKKLITLVRYATKCEEIVDTKEDDDCETPRLLGEAPTHIIHKISRWHMGVVAAMFFVRVFILAYMFHAGCLFLLTNHNYEDLLLNAVALAFIFELPQLLYAIVVPDDMKNALEDARTIPFHSALPKKGWGKVMISKPMWAMVFLPALVFAIVNYNLTETTEHSLEALECACLQRGPNCDVAERFKGEWWERRYAMPLRGPAWHGGN